MDDEARLFWVVDSPDSNEEIFATREQAEDYADRTYGKRAPYTIYIGEVRNYYQEPDGGWNYDDEADTFRVILTVTVQTG